MITTSKLVLSAAMVLGTVAAAWAEPRNPVRSHQHTNAIASQLQFVGPSAYRARAQVVAPQSDGRQWDAAYANQPLGPLSSPSIYGGGF